MQKLHIKPTNLIPEILFSPDENIFLIRGNSAPEDVRSLYYPVIEWIKLFIDNIIEGNKKVYSNDNPLIFQTELTYFNSSSAKFIYDIFLELKRLIPFNIPVVVQWIYDENDTDLKEGGEDIAALAGMEFEFVPEHKHLQ
jgi:hypothetical protein